jgi:hypothetical protein
MPHSSSSLMRTLLIHRTRYDAPQPMNDHNTSDMHNAFARVSFFKRGTPSHLGKECKTLTLLKGYEPRPISSRRRSFVHRRQNDMSTATYTAAPMMAHATSRTVSETSPR